MQDRDFSEFHSSAQLEFDNANGFKDMKMQRLLLKITWFNSGLTVHNSFFILFY